MYINHPIKSQIPKLRNLWHEAFGDTEEFLNDFFSTAFCTERCFCVIADGEMAAALYWFDCLYSERPIAYIYAVATAKAYRGQGVCHKLMEHTHRYLAELGYEGAILVPGSNELFRFYEGMGYKTCSYIRKFNCTNEADEAQLRRVDKTEYAKLRRQWIASRGVIQENENLDFFETQAEFYAGESFLLAARGEADMLYGVEILGDESAAAGIVKALGYKEGSFRAPGNDIPFAMYLPLEKSKNVFPAYFGLAFD